MSADLHKSLDMGGGGRCVRGLRRYGVLAPAPTGSEGLVATPSQPGTGWRQCHEPNRSVGRYRCYLLGECVVRL